MIQEEKTMRPNDAPDNKQAGKKRPPSKQIPGPSVCVPAVPFSLPCRHAAPDEEEEEEEDDA